MNWSSVVEEVDGTGNAYSHERMNENMNYRNLIITSRAIYLSAFIVIILLQCSTLYARMKVVGDSELSQVYAQAGVSYNWGNSQYTISAHSFAFSDTDSAPLNWLEFNNLTISGSWDETNDIIDQGVFPYYHFNSIDIGTVTTIDNQTRTVLSMVNSDNTSPQTWNIGNLVFCSQDLGSIQFDIKTIEPSLLNLTAHGAGSSGIEFEYLAQWSLENFTYAYNTNGGSLNVAGINLSESATGAPEDPSSWQFSGRFRIGDILGGAIDVDSDPSNTAYANPATFDVGTSSDGTATSTSIYLNLPMKGAIRAESVNFGGTDFGPVAIDGITVHHLAIRINPGN